MVCEGVAIRGWDFLNHPVSPQHPQASGDVTRHVKVDGPLLLRVGFADHLVDGAGAAEGEQTVAGMDDGVAGRGLSSVAVSVRKGLMILACLA